MEVGSLAAAETLALDNSLVTITSEIGTWVKAYVVLQGSQVAVRIQLKTMVSVMVWVVILHKAYVVLPLGALHDLEIPVVHLQGILLAEILETLLEALVLPHPQLVRLVQQAILSQQVY